MKFLDEAKIYVSSGHGGSGAVSFRREKFIEYGGPDGGKGGRGAHVYITAVENLNTLIDFRYTQHFKGKRGGNGMGRNRTGKDAEDIIIKVPVGTQVFAEDKQTLMCDLTHEGQIFQLATGGDGGQGNFNFKSSTNRAPRHAEPGWPGEELWVWLKLKLIADVGLLGLPNAGKSSFLSTVSRAKAKVADYPFTTLAPQLGMVDRYNERMVIADIPGLIEDAHLGVGLGHRFLGHVERCKALIHLIDVASDTLVEDYLTIIQEIEAYDSQLILKERLTVFNKCDLISEEELQEKIKLLQPYVEKIYPISVATTTGIDAVLDALLKIRSSGLELI